MDRFMAGNGPQRLWGDRRRATPTAVSAGRGGDGNEAGFDQLVKAGAGSSPGR